MDETDIVKLLSQPVHTWLHSAASVGILLRLVWLAIADLREHDGIKGFLATLWLGRATPSKPTLDKP